MLAYQISLQVGLVTQQGFKVEAPSTYQYQIETREAVEDAKPAVPPLASAMAGHILPANGAVIGERSTEVKIKTLPFLPPLL